MFVFLYVSSPEPLKVFSAKFANSVGTYVRHFGRMHFWPRKSPKYACTISSEIFTACVLQVTVFWGCTVGYHEFVPATLSSVPPPYARCLNLGLGRGGGSKFSDAFLKRRDKRGVVHGAEIQKDVFRCIAYFLLFHKEVGFNRSEDFRVTK